MSITGDLNCRSTNWWEGDIDKEEGISLEASTSDLGLYKMTSEPTHFMGSSRSYTNLVFTDQPNIFLETGAHPSLQKQCHHQWCRRGGLGGSEPPSCDLMGAQPTKSVKFFGT